MQGKHQYINDLFNEKTGIKGKEETKFWKNQTCIYRQNNFLQRIERIGVRVNPPISPAITVQCSKVD